VYNLGTWVGKLLITFQKKPVRKKEKFIAFLNSNIILKLNIFLNILEMNKSRITGQEWKRTMRKYILHFIKEEQDIIIFGKSRCEQGDNSKSDLTGLTWDVTYIVHI
jgi:hypothetical protein